MSLVGFANLLDYQGLS